MNLFLRTSLLSLIVFFLAPAQAQTVAATPVPATGSTGCTGPEALSNLQRRIVEKATDDTALIRFVHGTHMIHRLDLMQTAAWLEQRRARLAACGMATTTASASAVTP